MPPNGLGWAGMQLYEPIGAILIQNITDLFKCALDI